MNVIISSLGSIGKRHARILVDHFKATVFYIPRHKGFDSNFVDQYGIKVYDNLAQLKEIDLDFGVVCSPTSHHLETAFSYSEFGLPFLIEKPVSHSLENTDKLLRVVRKKGLPVLVGFQLRHHPGYIKLSEDVTHQIGKPLLFQSYVGQYLPNWRPGGDYTTHTSAKKALGGGVLLDLCHAVDIQLSLMGSVKEVSAMVNAKSHLNIETEDIADITCKHLSGAQSHIHLNYLDHDYTWTTRVVGTEGTTHWDYRNGKNTLVSKNGTKKLWSVPETFQRDDMFVSQFEHWLKVLEKKEAPIVGLKQGIEVNQLFAKIKVQCQNIPL